MTDDELKKGVKKSVVFFIIGILVIICTIIYISVSPSSKDTIYEEYASDENTKSGVSQMYLTTKGINKEELEKYLSVIANLTRKNLPEDVDNTENYLYMVTALNFLKEIQGEELTGNEAVENVVKTENDLNLKVEKEKINNILKELCGRYIRTNLNVANYFELDDATDIYKIKKEEDKVSYLVELSSAEFENDVIKITYKNVFGKNEEISKLMNNEKVTLETYEIKVILKENEDHDVSKFYVRNTEILSKEKVEYNAEK